MATPNKRISMHDAGRLQAFRAAALVIFTAFSISTLLGTPTTATPLDPNAFISIGTLAGGAIAIDTDTLTVTGGGSGVVVAQGGAPLGQKSGGPSDIAVFTFDGGSVLGDVTITGSRAAAILFQGAGQVTGSINVSGGSVSGTTAGALGAVGGGRGGSGEPFGVGIPNGFGIGGGTGGTTSSPISGGGPGSGGGFGTAGGVAGAGVTFVQGGIAYGDIVAQLAGGSGGGGGGGHNGGVGGGGGAGGGALEIGALNDLILSGATLIANGGDGGVPSSTPHGGGGGGSGGAILLHGFNVSIDVTSMISANGGDGGSAGLFYTPVGSCGGAGQIAVLTNDSGTLTNNGQVESEAGHNGDGVACALAFSPLYLTDPEIGQGTVVAMSAPASIAFFGIGLVGLGYARRKRTA